MMVKKILKWTLLVLLVVGLCGLGAFLYFIPPFFIVAPETFSASVPAMTPSVDHISDPAVKALAQRGRYIVMTTGCNGCHGTPGPQGPIPEMYLAGGFKFISLEGTFVSRNLTPDPETGLAKRSDEDVKRVLLSGTFPDGHVVSHTLMPWANFSSWSEEDRHAVVTFLRHIKPVRHQIPDPTSERPKIAGALEEDYGGVDYGVKPK